VTKPAEPVKPPPLEEEPEPTVDTAQPGMFSTPLRKAAIGAAAVGVIGIAGTVVFGTKANNKQSQADDLCPAAPACSDPMAIKLNDDARSAAMTSNVMLGVGVVGIGAAVALWFVGAPKAVAAESDVAIVPVTNGRDVGISFSGSF
jgi:threonine dehydrogenase-like Zn-dependent dehydrogenase